MSLSSVAVLIEWKVCSSGLRAFYMFT